MTPWKERGVVPDSEDDDDSGSDSPSRAILSTSPKFSPTTPSLRTVPKTRPQHQPHAHPQSSIESDIWNVPQSSEHQIPAQAESPRPLPGDISSEIGVIPLEHTPSSPLSWLSATPPLQNSPPRTLSAESRPDRELSRSQDLVQSSLNPLAGPEPPFPSQPLNETDLDTTGDNASNGNVELIDEQEVELPPQPSSQQLTPQLLGHSEAPLQLQASHAHQTVGGHVPSVTPSATASARSFPRSSPYGSPISGPSQIEPSATQELLAETTPEQLLRFQNEAPKRTFRPRKPIQQHPYLLEIASYNQQLKSHGVKPLRIAQSSQDSRKRREESDSQDKDFEEDSQGAPLPEDDIENLVVGAEELNLLTSSSTKNPPRRMRRLLDRGSPSPASQTIGPSASQGSDDLPTLDDLISSRTPRKGKRPSSPSTARQSKKRARLPAPRADSPDSLALLNSTEGTAVPYATAQDQILLSSSPPINTSARRRLRPSSQAAISFHTPSKTADRTTHDDTFNDFYDFNQDDELQVLPHPAQKTTAKGREGSTAIVIPSSPGIGPLTNANSDLQNAYSARHKRPRRQSSSEDEVAVDKDSNNEGDSSGQEEEETQVEEDNQQQLDSEEDIDAALKKFGRRLRGVLPPSYLRLADEIEKQKQKQIARKANATVPTRRQPTSPKRGVAQTRIGTGRTHDSFLQSIQDSDDEDSQPAALPRLDYVQTHISLDTLDVDDFETQDNYPGNQDGDSSDMEEDIIDKMMSASRKRPSKSSRLNGSAGQKRLKTSVSSSRAGKVASRNQPSITSHFRSSSTRNAPAPASKSSARKKPSSTRNQPPPSRSKSNKIARTSQPRKKAPPPKLSILDTLEANAPRFVRLAARRSRLAAGDGRTSPSRKVFQLANVWDNQDVNTVLSEWKEGRIKQRDLSVSKSRKPPSSRPPARNTTPRAALWDSLDAINGDSASIHDISASSLAPGTTREIWNMDGTRTLAAAIPAPKGTESQNVSRPIRRGGVFVSKPDAGLRRERPNITPPTQQGITASQSNYYNNRQKVANFQAGKRILDELYERTKKKAPAKPALMASVIPGPQHPGPGQGDAVPLLAEDEDMFDLDQPVVNQAAIWRKRKVRKQFKPRQVDVHAPQFLRSNDPLPTVVIEDDGPVVPARDALSKKPKLLGLGPFGTHYTLHFGVFPLSTNVSFHADTLLGKGLINRAVEKHDAGWEKGRKLTVSFLFGGIGLHWGPWDAKVSSELGVLLDSILDNLNGPSDENPMPDSVVIEGADFILNYLQNTVTFADPASGLSFVSRILDVFRSFRSRIEGLQVGRKALVVQVLTRILIAALSAHCICKSQPELLSEAINMETMLVDLSKATIKVLLAVGLQPLHDFYVSSQRETSVQRAIPANETYLHAWVVLMRILEAVNIPRMSFWDVLYAVLILPQDLQGTAASRFEKLWETMFTLLPLREFDDLGALMPGMRRVQSMDGWALPQKLIRRVFDIYREGSALQSPSFNEYCRALVGRCHYLIEEWGWIKCNGIVGLIFDFFGSQNLSHLRNEEVFKSPGFLEELCRGPSLSVEAGDRCFHIFLKLVALAIKQLNDRKMSTEVRNLIARIMPNHNRQFLKDQNIHHQDLASLRNHHDLLCTIFWAAPPDLRPNAQLIAKLVTPSESHKEACLVNLRAWNQLARFVAATNQDPKVFRAFMSWQNNIFRQLLDQFESVASDMQAQLLALPKGTNHGLSQSKIDMFVSLNRAAIKDMIFFSVRASQDIFRHGKTREAAVFALNTYQLNEILRQFTYSPPMLDWSILGAGLETLRMFFDRDCAVSGDSSLDAVRRSDAVLLQRELATNLFAAARTVLTEREAPKLASSGTDMVREMCIENLVLLCARATNLLSRIGAMKVSDVFSGNKWSLFEGDLHRLRLAQRRYVPLYVATHVGELPESVEPHFISVMDLWAMSICKPSKFVIYEHLLASELLRRGKPYLPRDAVALAANASYSTQHQLFEFFLAWMRTSLRKSTVSARKSTVSSFSNTLRLVMEQVKLDLQALSSSSPQVHEPYVLFIRKIINLIRSYATDICAVDTFFYQITKDYSPPVQDPKLRVAGIVSYGLRLRDGDSKVVPQLFHYLYNNFKIALVNNSTDKEASIIRHGMEHADIRMFVLTKMFPAVIRAMIALPYTFFFLDVYASATLAYYCQPVVPGDLSARDLENVALLLDCMLTTMYDLIRSNSVEVSLYVVHSIIRCIQLVRALWPLVRIHGFEPDLRAAVGGIVKDLGRIVRITRAMESCIAEWRSLGRVDTQHILSGIDPTRREKLRSENDVNVISFASIIETDVSRSWEVRGGRLFMRGAGSDRPGVAPPGYPMPLLPLKETLDTLEEEVGCWNHEWKMAMTPELAEREMAREILGVFPDLIL
ncbi:Protein mms22 [Ceratocystis lukuohia]|uniref:Protein mms22 n=1 Tax=Ceratocystis lukuohia TaxID=2019550 RepID=A0ABR4MD53_9PEZI